MSIEPEQPQRPARSRDTRARGQANTDPELLERVVDHFTRRLRRGEHPSIQEYQQRFPQLREEIEELLSSAAMIEQLKGAVDPEAESRRQFDSIDGLRKIGSYQVVREVGRGGMGIVFEAIHQSLGRRVAIKVLPLPLVDGKKHIQRFRREAQSAARLHHTNIVSVFGVGETDGFHYYVMDFVDGQSLGEIMSALQSSTSAATPTANDPTRIDLDRTPAAEEQESEFEIATGPPTIADRGSTVAEGNGSGSLEPSTGLESGNGSGIYQPWGTDDLKLGRHARYFRRVARIGASVADALAYAHSKRVLHRDIKPSNLMLDRQGVVWITDFGLAKDHSDEINLTRTGDVIGTPQYLAPESLEGRYDQRSETYCLGLTLYELVTLRPAYPSGSPGEVLRAIATSSPVSPRKIDRRIPLDLSTIIDKALARDPKQRYQSAEDLKSDLLAFADDRPIAARPPHLWETVVRWARRNPLPAGLAALSAVLLTAVAVVATVGYLVTTAALEQEAEKSLRLTQQQQATIRAKQEAEQNLEHMRVQFNRAEANVGLTIEAFDKMFRRVIGGQSATKDLDIDGLREISGIESTLSSDDIAFLDRMLEFYGQFAALNVDNEQLKLESAKAFRRVGNICQLVGKMDDAVNAYQQSLALYGDLWEAQAGSKANLLDRVQLQNELSSALRASGQAAEAHQLSRDSILLLEDAVAESNDPEVRLELARTLSATGLNLLKFMGLARPAGNPRPDGRGANRDAPSPFAPTPATNSNRRRNPTWTWEKLIGGGRQGMASRNRQLIRRAIDITSELVDEAPENPEYISARATCYSIMAAAELPHDRERAMESRDKAIEDFSRLVDQYPDNPQHRYFLALAKSTHADPPNANDFRLLQDAVNQAEILVTQSPNRLDFHQLLGKLKIKMSVLMIHQRRPDEALQHLKDAKSSIEFMLERTPSDRTFPAIAMGLANYLDRVAQLYRDEGQLKQAMEVSRIRNELRSDVRDAFPGRRRD